MPKFTIKIESQTAPPFEATRKCETLRDVRKLFKDADHSLAVAARIWPRISDVKVTRLSVAKE